MDHMFQGAQGWIMERFRRNWEYMGGDDKNRAMNVGHNIETSWLGLRLYQLTSNREYLDMALRLSDSLDTYAFKNNGVWYHRVEYSNPDEHPRTTPWWVQAYGNMTQLYLFRMTGENEHLNQFKKGAQFWNQHFLDEEYGGVVLSTYVNGAIDRGDKAVRSKTSYHSVEHALLNYIYLNLWVQNEDITLHYYVEDPNGRKRLYPLPIEEFTYQIKQVEINGKEWENINRAKGYIRLPDEGPAEITVRIRDNA